MSLTFANFKQRIPSPILTRGRDYLRRGYVVDLTYDEDDGAWEALVEGSELYDVRIEQETNGQLRCSCTCPYDMGEHCKHVAAVLYGIEEAFPDQLVEKPRRKAGKRQTRHDKLRVLLEKASHEQVVTVLLELTQHDRELLNQLLLHLDSGAAKPMDYRRVVKDVLRASRGDEGYLDYTGTNRAGRKLEELLERAEQWRNIGELDKAVGLYQALIDEIAAVIGSADDSNGVLGDCISMALENLTRTAEQQGEAGRDALIAYCLDRARKTEFHNFDWQWELLAIVKELIDTPERKALMLSALAELEIQERKTSAGHGFTFGLEQIALFKLALIDRFDGEAAAEEFLYAHIHLDRLRMELIERLRRKGAFKTALELLQDGIKASEKRRLPGLTNQYRALEVTLLQYTGDSKRAIAIACRLWLERGDDEQLSVLKQLTEASEWPAFVAELAKDVRRPELVARLYASENQWREVLRVVLLHPHNAWLLEPYRKQLESQFPAEIAALYARVVDGLLERAADRTDYKQIVLYLRQMKLLGHGDRAETIAERIRVQYTKRPALLDELSTL